MRVVTSLSVGLAMLLIAHPSIAIAEYRILACQNKLTEAYIQSLPAFNSQMCEQFGKDYCNARDNDVSKGNLCRGSGLSYSHKKTFTFDPDALRGVTTLFADGFTETCWGARTDLQKFAIVTTPTTISFVENNASFTIDRQTLQAGYGSNRDYQCELGTVTNKNKL